MPANTIMSWKSARAVGSKSIWGLTTVYVIHVLMHKSEAGSIEPAGVGAKKSEKIAWQGAICVVYCSMKSEKETFQYGPYEITINGDGTETWREGDWSLTIDCEQLSQKTAWQAA